MKKWVVPGLCGAMALCLIPINTDAAIRRVPARYNMIDFFGGYSMPLGEYDAIGSIPLYSEGGPIEIDGDLLFEDTWHIGFHYGSFWSRHALFTLGFRYIRSQVNEEIILDANDLNVDQYDLDMNIDLYPIDLTEYPFSPFAGAGFRAGFTSVGWENYDTESQFNFALAANFGADLKLFASPDNRSFVTLASVNSIELLGSDDRPKYLNIGGAIRYWFR